MNSTKFRQIICEHCGTVSERPVTRGPIPRHCNRACSAAHRLGIPPRVVS